MFGTPHKHGVHPKMQHFFGHPLVLAILIVFNVVSVYPAPVCISPIKANFKQHRESKILDPSFSISSHEIIHSSNGSDVKGIFQVEG